MWIGWRRGGYTSRTRESVTSRVESGNSRNVTEKKAGTSNELQQKISFIDPPFSPEVHVSSLWKITRASFARQSRRSQSPKEIRHTTVGEGSGWLPLKGICKLVGLCASSTSVMRQTSLFVEDGFVRNWQGYIVERIWCKD